MHMLHACIMLFVYLVVFKMGSEQLQLESASPHFHGVVRMFFLKVLFAGEPYVLSRWQWVWL